jgi:hypothetical protein
MIPEGVSHRVSGSRSGPVLFTGASPVLALLS